MYLHTSLPFDKYPLGRDQMFTLWHFRLTRVQSWSVRTNLFTFPVHILPFILALWPTLRLTNGPNPTWTSFRMSIHLETPSHPSNDCPLNWYGVLWNTRRRLFLTSERLALTKFIDENSSSFVWFTKRFDLCIWGIFFGSGSLLSEYWQKQQGSYNNFLVHSELATLEVRSRRLCREENSASEHFDNFRRWNSV